MPCTYTWHALYPQYVLRCSSSCDPSVAWPAGEITRPPTPAPTPALIYVEERLDDGTHIIELLGSGRAGAQWVLGEDGDILQYSKLVTPTVQECAIICSGHPHCAAFVYGALMIAVQSLHSPLWLYTCFALLLCVPEVALSVSDTLCYSHQAPGPGRPNPNPVPPGTRPCTACKCIPHTPGTRPWDA